MIQHNQFTGYPNEDPNEHMGRLLKMANTVKLNRVRLDVVKLQLFPFSLRDTTTSWFESLPYGLMNTWDELVEAFMGRFFPLTLTSKRRRGIIIFEQGEDESLYNAWERYKKLLKRCLMHGIDQITQMDIFYHAMNYISKGIINAACSGAFKRKSTEEANQLIEDLAKSNYRAQSETSGSSSKMRESGVIELNKMSAIEAKLNALMNKVSMQERSNCSTHLVGTMKDQQGILNNEGLAQDGPYQQEEVQFINGNGSYNFKPNTNLPTHYTPALRISHMDLQHNKDRDLCRIISSSMVNIVSKDNSSRIARELRIMARERPSLLKNRW